MFVSIRKNPIPFFLISSLLLSIPGVVWGVQGEKRKPEEDSEERQEKRPYMTSTKTHEAKDISGEFRKAIEDLNKMEDNQSCVSKITYISNLVVNSFMPHFNALSEEDKHILFSLPEKRLESILSQARGNSLLDEDNIFEMIKSQKMKKQESPRGTPGQNLKEKHTNIETNLITHFSEFKNHMAQQSNDFSPQAQWHGDFNPYALYHLVPTNSFTPTNSFITPLPVRNLFNVYPDSSPSAPIIIQEGRSVPPHVVSDEPSSSKPSSQEVSRSTQISSGNIWLSHTAAYQKLSKAYFMHPDLHPKRFTKKNPPPMKKNDYDVIITDLENIDKTSLTKRCQKTLKNLIDAARQERAFRFSNRIIPFTM